MKKYVVLVALLALSTSAWGYTVGTCCYNPCGNTYSCWNPCQSPCYIPSCGTLDNTYSYASNRECAKQVCSPIIGVWSSQEGCGFTATTCFGGIGGFGSSGHTQVLGCGYVPTQYGCGTNLLGL
jgi:hypothetical protein